MKQKGDLFWAAAEVNAKKFPVFYWSKIERDKYLIVVDSIFKSDPIKFRFTFISQKKFNRISKDYTLQPAPTRLS